MEETEVRVESVREVGPGTVALELSTPPGFEAAPGQFVVVRATVDGEELTRYYTLSSPSVEESFEITVGVDPDGDLSPWLAALEGGDRLRLEGPHGSIAYRGGEDVVAVAGGPGVGPAVAIAEAAHAAGREAAVIYRDDEPAHTERLSALADAGADVEILAAGEDEALAAAVADRIADGRFYVFGFSEFVGAVADAIADAGGDPDEAEIENFG